MSALVNTVLKIDSKSSFTPRKLRFFINFCLVFTTFAYTCKGLIRVVCRLIAIYMLAMISSPNSEVPTWVAPSI